MLKVDRIFRDDNSDGVWDYMFEDHKWLDQNGNVDLSLAYTDEGADGLDYVALTDNVYDSGGKLQISATDGFRTGGDNSRYVTNYYYDEKGRYSGEYGAGDSNMDGTPDQQWWVARTYDDAGRTLTTTTDSDFYPADGIVDRTEVESYTYTANGQTEMIDWSAYYGGVLNEQTHVTYEYAYNDRGLVSQLTLPSYDPDASDVAWKYSYTGADQLKKVTIQNPDRFGDEKFHNSETYSYFKDGTLKESNVYDTYVNDQYVLEDKGKFTYDDGLLVKEVHTGQNTKWKTITGWKDDLSYNENGQLDTKLTSFDLDGNGIYETDTRTLQEWSYHEDGSVAYYQLDENTGDGIIESIEQYDTLIA